MKSIMNFVLYPLFEVEHVLPDRGMDFLQASGFQCSNGCKLSPLYQTDYEMLLLQLLNEMCVNILTMNCLISVFGSFSIQNMANFIRMEGICSG